MRVWKMVLAEAACVFAGAGIAMLSLIWYWWIGPRSSRRDQLATAGFFGAGLIIALAALAVLLFQAVLGIG
jgi:hypothetical protein